jgi:hypothetical protein
MGGNRQQLAARFQRADAALQDAQRGPGGSEGPGCVTSLPGWNTRKPSRGAEGVLLSGTGRAD